jgi:hypothetical protein
MNIATSQLAAGERRPELVERRPPPAIALARLAPLKEHVDEQHDERDPDCLCKQVEPEISPRPVGVGRGQSKTRARDEE